MDSERAVSHRVLNADQHRQVLIFDLDEIGGIACRRGGLRHDSHDLLTDKTHPVARQHRPFGDQNSLPAATGRR